MSSYAQLIDQKSELREANNSPKVNGRETEAPGLWPQSLYSTSHRFCMWFLTLRYCLKFCISPNSYLSDLSKGYSSSLSSFFFRLTILFSVTCECPLEISQLAWRAQAWAISEFTLYCYVYYFLILETDNMRQNKAKTEDISYFLTASSYILFLCKYSWNS